MDNHILAGTCLTLLFACASASAQDTQHPAPNAPLRLRTPAQDARGGPRMREAGPRLGVNVESTPDGLKVASVEDGTLASAAGVKAGDVLQRIGSQRVHEVDDVALALHGFEPGAQVEVTVVRPGEGLVTLSGTLPEAKPEEKQQLPATDGVKGGFLGVQMQTDPADGGVGVAGVVPDSAAWFAGLQEGDVLLSLDGKALASPEDLAGAVAGKEPGAFVELKFRREGAEQSAKVRLGRRAPQGLLGQLGNGRGMRMRVGPNGPDAQFMPFGMDPDQDFDDMQMPDMHQFMQRFPGGDGAMGQLHQLLQDGNAHSVEVRIDNDHMTITKDGATEEYHRGADGQWIRQGDKAPADATPRGA
jgi:membrane-associated protease RseP (regulator of RpoE activity)